MVTGVRQIVAEELGVAVEDVILLDPDTDAAAYDAGAQGSRTTFGIGNAARQACEEVRRQVLDVAGDMLEAAPEDLELADGHVQVVGAPESRVPLAAVAATATFSVGPIAASGRFIAPPIPFDAGCMVGALFTTFTAASYHVHLAEVEVDPETGKVTILRYVVAQDVGRAINPQMIEGQIHGAVAQGVGYALFEELRVEDGAVLDDSFETYRLPTVFDVPPIEISLLEIPCEYGPYGAKGAAEPPIVPAAAVIASAVADAIGQPVRQLPVTPFDILRALNGEGGSGH
jgi:CO/xanthine dehydrogenase Mo-binding subunit